MTMIYDRTQADVDEATRIVAKVNDGKTLTEDEQKRYDEGLKGKYNYTDFNRVEAKTAEVAALLTENGYPTEIAVKTDWKSTDKLRPADITRYLGNIAAIRRILPETMAPAAVPLTRWIDYTAANDIERTLAVVESAIDGILQNLRRCGTFAAGGSYTTQMIRRAT